VVEPLELEPLEFEPLAVEPLAVELGWSSCCTPRSRAPPSSPNRKSAPAAAAPHAWPRRPGPHVAKSPV